MLGCVSSRNRPRRCVEDLLLPEDHKGIVRRPLCLGPNFSGKDRRAQPWQEVWELS